MTIIGGKDRCDYRALGTQALIEEARYNPNVELCIALGERLEGLRLSIKQQDQELKEHRDRMALAVGAAVSMRAEIESYRENGRG